MSDSQARERARTCFDRPLVVEAGAGTGKTTTLIARICTWCIGPGWARAAAGGGDPSVVAARTLDGVVAITFTEAAAAEMASRFGSALVELASGRPVVGIPELPVPAVEAAARARALLGAVDRLGVSTIHAFCARVLASAPSEAGLHPAHRVDADQTERPQIVHEVVTDWFAAVFGPDSVTTEGASQLREWLLALAARGLGADELVAALDALASESIPVSALDDDPAPPEALAALVDRVRAGLLRLRTPLARALDGLAIPAKPAVDTFNFVEELLQATRGAPSPATVRTLAAVADAQPKNSALRRWSRGRFESNEPRLFGAAAAEISRASAAALDLVYHLQTLDLELLAAGRGVLAPLLSKVQAVMRQRGVVTFTQLLRGAHALLRDDPLTLERTRSSMTQLLVDEFQDTDDIQCGIVRMLALEGEVRPGLFLVGDPKQSIYGWRSADLVAYQSFVDGVVAGGGECLRLDVNRRSLVPILDEVERVVSPVMVFDRGYQALFQPLRSARVGEPPPPAPWQPVEHWLSWRMDSSGAREPLLAAEVAVLEAEALAADIGRLHAEGGVSWEKIGVLMRSQGDLEVYLTAFREAGIPFVVERNRQYFKRREIIDAIALVRCILEPEDTLALLTVLRSPLVGAPDAALLSLWRERLPERVAELHGIDEESVETIRQIAGVAARIAGASGAPGVERVEGWQHLLVETMAAIGWLRAAFDILPVDAFVAELRERLPLETLSAARYLGEYRVANLQRFYGELVVSLSEGGSETVLRALRTGLAGHREAEEARPTDAAERAVRVMTIHKSKGLDFDHVYLLQLHKGRREGRKDTSTKVVAFQGGWQLSLFGARSLGYDALDTHEARVEANERVRLLYVAMTRARDRLVMLGGWPEDVEPVPVERAGSLLDLVMWRAGRPDLHEVAAAGAVLEDGALWKLAPVAAGHRSRPRRAAFDLPVTATGEAARRESAAERMARTVSVAASSLAHEAIEAPKAAASGRSHWAAAVGTAVHLVLEHMDGRQAPEVALAAAEARVRAAVRSTVAAADHEVALGRALRLVREFVGGPLGLRFRRIGPHILARELPTLSAPGETVPAVGFVSGTIDMLYRDPDTHEIVVVDYKTDGVQTVEERDARTAAYRLQLQIYVRAVQAALGLPAPPRAELWYLSRGEVVVV